MRAESKEMKKLIGERCLLGLILNSSLRIEKIVSIIKRFRNNNLSSLYAPVDSGATQVAYYGGFGMPTVVVLGGADHQVLFTTQSFVTSDTTTIKEAILNMFQNANGLNDIKVTGDKFMLFPNPANEFLNIATIEKGISSLHVDITDITGKNVMSFSNENFSSSSIDKINTTSLNNGNYFVNINLNGQSYIRKLMVIH